MRHAEPEGVFSDEPALRTAQQAQFVAYCDHFTDVRRWRGGAAPAGARVVRCLQARHDQVIRFMEGEALYAMLAGEQKERETRDIPTASRFVPMSGGHVWGFVRAGRLLPPAVLEALQELESVSTQNGRASDGKRS